MKKNVIYVDFKFTHKRIVSKKLHWFCKFNYLIKKFLDHFKQDNSDYTKLRPFKKIL